MSIPQPQIDLAVATAHTLEQRGYFERARHGDERAASLFARLVAYTANPNGLSNGWGALRKTGSGFNVEGYADGAIVWSSDPSNLHNVLKIVTQVGSDHAGIGDAEQERRPSDIWERPHALSDEQMTYLLAGGMPIPVPPPTQPVQPYPSESPDGGWWGQVFDVEVAKLYALKQRPYPDPSDPRSLRWCGRTAYDIRAGLTKEESLAKHLAELKAELGV